MSIYQAPVAISAVYPLVTLAGEDRLTESAERADKALSDLLAEGRQDGCIFSSGPSSALNGYPDLGWSFVSGSDGASALVAAWRSIAAGTVETAVVTGANPDQDLVVLRSRDRMARLGSEPLAWIAGADQVTDNVAATVNRLAEQSDVSIEEIGALDVYQDGVGTSVLRLVDAGRGNAVQPCWAHMRPGSGRPGFGALSRMTQAIRCGHMFAGEKPPSSGPPTPNLSFASQPMPWLRPPFGRHGLVLIGSAVLLLSEGRSRPRATISSRLADHPATLIVLTVSDPDRLDAALASVEKDLAQGEPYQHIAKQSRRCAVAAHPFAAALVVRSQAEAEREVALLRRGLHASAAVVKTPFGSLTSRRPLGAGADVVFVYPGAGSAYPGLGRDLCALFPGLMRSVEAGQPENATWFAEAQPLYPPDLASLDADEHAALETKLSRRHTTQFSGTVLSSMLFTSLVRNVLGITAKMAMGYCVGEVAMIAATGLWGDLEALHQRQSQSGALRQRVYGRMQAVRDYWGMGPEEPSIADRWQSHVLFAPPDDVSASVALEPRAYLTIVNSRSQAVIAGDADACGRVISRLGCRSMPLGFNTPGHSPAIASERDLFAALHHLPVTPDPTISFHAQIQSPLAQDSDSIAAAIAYTYTTPVDFPRLVEETYAAGGRVFLELGARQMCSAWIAETLGDRPHLAVPFDIKGADPAVAILRATAQLVAHRVDLRCGELFGDGESVSSVV